ncbi:MAG: branched-chain amino acid ABC transporter permease [Rhodoferax sp.]|nr:branched-chain amino acid ABC transporter permease [Rhodoferax sp.]
MKWMTPRTGGLALLTALLLLLPLVLVNNYWYEVAIQIGLNAIVCVGLNLLIGYAGQISLGHAGFFGIGAYGTAILSSRYGLPPVMALVMTTVGVALLALLVGRPILRLKGHYLAMATLGMGIIISIVIVTEDKFTGGPDGMSVPVLSLFGQAMSGERLWYWVVAVSLVGAVALALNLIESPMGRALRALNGSEVGARVSGIDATRAKVGVFVLSAVFASVAGSLMAHYSGFITPGKASFFHSIELVAMVVFGGMSSTFGAVIGATALTLLPQLLTVLKEYEMVVFGGVMVITMIFFPRGFLPSLMHLLARIRK